jgi:hypothetical protein
MRPHPGVLRDERLPPLHSQKNLGPMRERADTMTQFDL